MQFREAHRFRTEFNFQQRNKKTECRHCRSPRNEANSVCYLTIIAKRGFVNGVATIERDQRRLMMQLTIGIRFTIWIVVTTSIVVPILQGICADSTVPPVSVSDGAVLLKICGGQIADQKESTLAALQHSTDSDGNVLKHESFDHDPGWLGVNNRSATTRQPIKIRQDFGYTAQTSHVGGGTRGEIGGFVTPAGEAAYYGKKLAPLTLDQPLSASGTVILGQGGTNLLLGFFNSQTLNEWRTPNTVTIRLNGRGEKFFAYVEYCTSKWRAGATPPHFHR